MIDIYKFPEFISRTIDESISSLAKSSWITLYLWMRAKNIPGEICWIDETNDGTPMEVPGDKKLCVYAYTIKEREQISATYEENTEFEAMVNSRCEAYEAKIFTHTDENGCKKFFYEVHMDDEEGVIFSLIPLFAGYKLNEFEQKFFFSLHIGDYETLASMSRIMFKEEVREKELKIIKDNPDFGKQSIIKGLEAALAAAEKRIAECEHMIALTEKTTKNIQYQIYSTRYLSDDTQLYDYLLKREDIHVCHLNTEQNALAFQVETFLDMFESDVVETYINNEAFMHDITPIWMSTDEAKAIEKAIFVDQIFKIKGFATFCIGMEDVAVSQYNYKNLEGFMNPHYEYHNCLGDNRSVIRQCLKRGDVVSAIEMCCVAARVINPIEVAVTFKRFMKTILKDKEKPYLYKDGRLYNNMEALEYLRSKQEQEAEDGRQSENDGRDD